MFQLLQIVTCTKFIIVDLWEGSGRAKIQHLVCTVVSATMWGLSELWATQLYYFCKLWMVIWLLFLGIDLYIHSTCISLRGAVFVLFAIMFQEQNILASFSLVIIGPTYTFKAWSALNFRGIALQNAIFKESFCKGTVC